MGNNNTKTCIDPELIKIINIDESLKFILDENKYKKYNLLQRLILFSNNIFIKNYLVNNIEKYKNEINQTTLTMACSNVETFKILLNYNSDPKYLSNVLFSICEKIDKKSNIEIIKLLLDHGVDLNIINNNRMNALMVACMHTNIEIVKLLLDYGSNPNLIDEDGMDSLMLAY